MKTPVLMVTNAGLGETPPCPEAKFHRGDVVVVTGPHSSIDWPCAVTVLQAIPPGFAPEYAIADMLGEARPLMISKPSHSVTYIVYCDSGKWGVIPEKRLRETGLPPVEIGDISRGAIVDA
jgi:hypothetical protein